MRLKTRLKLAWLELVLAAVLVVGLVGLDIARLQQKSLGSIIIDVALTFFILLPLCVMSWNRLRKVHTQLSELGPDGSPSADLWTAPGAPGVIGVMVLALAVAVALAPALLAH